MLDAVKEIGDILLKKDIKNQIEILIEDPNPNQKYNNVFCLTFEENGEIKYIGIELEDYESDKIIKYLYRSGPSNGPNFTPSTKVTEIEKTLYIKVLNWFKDVFSRKNLELSKEEKEYLEKIYTVLKNHENEIIEEFKQKSKDISKKEGIFLTLKFKKEGKTEYIGDKEVFIKTLEKLVKIKESKKGSNIGQCSICLEEKEVTIGDGIYAFYTIDKPGFICGGFKEKEAWKNFPLCEDCRRSLEKGKEYIEKELTFKMAGISYQLIPKFLLGREFIKEDVYNIFFDTPKLLSLKKNTAKRYLGDEEDILQYLSDTEDYITLNFLFIERKQSAEKILALIEDVLPSRLRSIFKAKEKVDKLFNTDFTMRNLWTFFSKSDPDKRETDLVNYFLEIVDRIFKDRSIDKNFIFQFFTRKIRTQYVRDEYFSYVVKDALMSLLFLLYLDLIPMEVINMEEERLFEPIFKKFSPTFNHPIKKGLFLLGALTQMLLNVQYLERGSDPFRKQLKSLKMEEKDFKGLLPKVINKLQEYDSFDIGKQKLAEEASYYLLLAGDNWKLSNDELNFYFACGMNLLDELKPYIYPDKK
uniref:TIGR02556 family CRISPR-associated protein n=1 Tax=Dictyoglomus thermophilum TaxID=14 RepID=A0A7C3MJC0_DICTH